MSTRITLEQFTALNEELAALARVGIPLERGLADLSRDLPGRLGTLAGEIGRRLSDGESLLQVLSDERLGVPVAYRAVLEAGVRSGRLGQALQDVAETARRARELRLAVFLAQLYPVLVVMVAYVVLLVLLVIVTPRILAAYPPLTESFPTAWDWLLPLGASAPLWAPWPPVIGLALLIVYWRRMSIAAERGSPALSYARSRWPTPGRVLALGRLATLLDILGMLIAHQVPLPDALCLAAEASGVARWRRGAGAAAERLRGGERLTRTLLDATGLPVILGWLQADGMSEARCAASSSRRTSATSAASASRAS